MNTSMLRVAAVSAAVLGLSMPALANFSGDYAPEKWTTTNVGPNPFDEGSVDSSPAPGSISLIGSNTDSGQFLRLEYTIVAPFTGTVSFDWAYVSDDLEGPGYDPAGRLLNGDITQLTVDADPSSQSGQASFNVTAGQTFGFYVLSIDNFEFNGGATLTITNFAAPVPESASVAMMLLGLLGVAAAAARRRRST